jgi:hypothetical protein
MMKKGLATGMMLVSSLSSFASGVYLSPSLVFNHINAANSGYQAVEPELAIGYSTQYGEYIRFAGELFISPTSIAIHNNDQDGINVKTDYGLGASFLPGYQLDEELLGYGRFSVMSTRLGDLGTTREGFQLGIGLQERLTRVWSIRGEYDYVWYRSLSSIGTIRAKQVGIGLVYKF